MIFKLNWLNLKHANKNPSKKSLNIEKYKQTNMRNASLMKSEQQEFVKNHDLYFANQILITRLALELFTLRLRTIGSILRVIHLTKSRWLKEYDQNWWTWPKNWQRRMLTWWIWPKIYKILPQRPTLTGGYDQKSKS